MNFCSEFNISERPPNTWKGRRRWILDVIKQCNYYVDDYPPATPIDPKTRIVFTDIDQFKVFKRSPGWWTFYEPHCEASRRVVRPPPPYTP